MKVFGGKYKTLVGIGIEFTWVSGRVATKIFEDFGGALNKAFFSSREPVSIIHYTRPGSSIKWPTPN